jgi:response regulator RpfG family c-di-GMP phosphodiesterase
VLLRETLLGSIHTLMEILSLANPPAFGRATRVRQVVSEMINRRGEVQDSWQIEVAAMLSQIGCIALAGSTVERLYYGQTLTPDEQAQVDRLPEMAGQLLSHIPRLEPVREILSHQGKHFDGSGVPPGNLQGEAIPWGARALKVILDFDILRSRDLEPAVALEVMRSRTGWYDPALLEDFAKMQVNVTPSVEERELPLAEVEEGMVFAEDVKTRTGALLIARGHQATRGTLKRIRSLSPGVGVKEPIKISVQKSFSHQT